MQHYTHNLVTEELNLGNMIESSLAQIMTDKERENKISLDSDDEDEDAEFNKELFKYQEDNPITNEDVEELNNYEQHLKDIDQELV